MKPFLHQGRRCLVALIALLTGRATASMPQNPHLRRDLGLSEHTLPVRPSRITAADLAHRALG